MWKLEGYPEYIARQDLLQSSAYSLADEIRRFIATDEHERRDRFEAVAGHFAPTYYFKGRIMIEFLMDVRGLSYDEILRDKRTEREVFNEMQDWLGQADR